MLIQLEVQMQLAIIMIIGVISHSGQEFLNVVFDQQGVAKDTHDLNNRPVQFEFVFNNGDQAVRDDGHMYLYPDSILRFSPKRFDTEMLLDPFEKQFDLPSVAVEKGNFFCFEVEVVGVIGESPSKVRGIEYDASERNRVVSVISLASEPNRLIPQDIVVPIKHIISLGDFIIRMGLLPYDEESPSLLNCVESGEIKVSPVKYIAGVPFVYEPVHGLGVMHIRIADSVKDRYFGDNINLGMNLDARLCAPKLCPSIDRHAQVDGSGINGIKPSVEFKFFGDTFGLGNRNNVKGKLLKDSRVSEAVCFGKNASIDGNLSKPQVKRSFSMGNSNICEFSETMAAYELAVHNDQHVAPVGWCHPGCPVLVLYYQSFEVTFWEKLYNLRENIFATVHNCSNLCLNTKEQNSKGRQVFKTSTYCN
jgi:hypothetical protein